MSDIFPLLFGFVSFALEWTKQLCIQNLILKPKLPKKWADSKEKKLKKLVVTWAVCDIWKGF